MPLVYVTSPQSSIHGIPEMIAAAKAKPDALNTAVSTTTCRMAHELLKMHTSVSMLPIDFKGSAQSISAVLGSHVEFMVDTVASLQTQINAGQLKALGVTSAHTSRLLPGVKSIAEQGITGYELVGWTVIFAPKGVSAQASQVISSALEQLLSTPRHQAKLMQMGIEPQFKTGPELKDFVAKEKDKWGRLVQASGLKPS
jgi:tripartite-type tricarboxylate transporter receptor subunit TctC